MVHFEGVHHRAARIKLLQFADMLEHFAAILHIAFRIDVYLRVKNSHDTISAITVGTDIGHESSNCA